MAVTWGAYSYATVAGYNSNGGMRVGEEITWSAVDSNSATVTATIDIWTQNIYAYTDDQNLNFR